jgi:hypothetical protein
VVSSDDYSSRARPISAALTYERNRSHHLPRFVPAHSYSADALDSTAAQAIADKSVNAIADDATVNDEGNHYEQCRSLVASEVLACIPTPGFWVVPQSFSDMCAWPLGQI